MGVHYEVRGGGLKSCDLMTKTPDTVIAVGAEETADLAGVGIMIDMETSSVASGFCSEADCAGVPLFCKHAVVSAVRQAKSGFQCDVGFPVRISASPFSVVGGVLGWVVAIARNDRLFLAVLAPVLSTIFAVAMMVKLIKRFIEAATTTFLHQPLLRTLNQRITEDGLAQGAFG